MGVFFQNIVYFLIPVCNGAAVKGTHKSHYVTIMLVYVTKLLICYNNVVSICNNAVNMLQQQCC